MFELEERDLSKWLQSNLPKFHKSKVNQYLPPFEIVPNGLYFFLVQSFLHKYQIEPKGMIHVGGHMGHEILPYALLGFNDVLIIEPLEEAMEALSNISSIYNDLAASCTDVFGGSPFIQISLEQLAAGEKEGRTTLYVTKESGLSSTHKPMSEVQVNGEDLAAVIKEEEVIVRPIDQIISERYSKTDFNCMRVNVQGDELAVFKGAQKVIRQLDLIFCEANYDQRYENIPSTQDLIQFLENLDFSLVRHDKLSDSIGNLLFINNSKNGHGSKV
ncbi:MAG: FkbM family methyltransferase [Saprospiraceae bacterium]|jgi:FkbM family methyltransferase